MKICTKCRELKPLSAFYKDKYAKDGLTYKCKECQRISGKKYYKSNIEKEREYGRKYYHENRELCLARNREYMRTPAGKIAQQKHDSKRRDFGHRPLNKWFEGSHFHHLHINDDDEGIFIPEELHSFIWHNSITGDGMDAMNIIALLYLMQEKYL
jgi:hypothetical protein